MGTGSEVRRDVAWGKVLSVKDASGNEITNPNHIGLINPIRYRGYYYDNETELYYLQSRYYDATLGRFISPDDTVYLGATGDFISYNLYAYCGNDPVNMRDEEGNLPKWIKKTVKAGGDFVASVAGVITQIRSTQNTSQTFLKIAVASSVAVVFGNATVGDVWTDVKNYRFFNKALVQYSIQYF